MTSPRLWARGYGEMLDEVMALYRDDWLLFFALVGLVQIPAVLVSWAVGAMDLPPPGPPHLIDRSVILDFLVAGFFGSLQHAAVLAAASNRYLGRRASLAGAYRHALRTWPRLLAIKVAQYLLIGFGFILLIVPGIIFSLWTTFVSEVCVLEGASWSATWERSRYLASNQWGRIIVFYLIATLLVVTFAIQPQIVTAFFIKSRSLQWHITQVWQSVGRVAFQPLWSLASMILYYDVRIRQEAFDLRLRSEALLRA